MFKKAKSEPIVKVIGAQYRPSKVLTTKHYANCLASSYYESESNSKSLDVSETVTGDITIILYTVDGALKEKQLNGKWTLEQAKNMTRVAKYDY